MAQVGFWDNQEGARRVVSEIKTLKSFVDPWIEAEASVADAAELLDLAEAEDDADTVAEIEAVVSRYNHKGVIGFCDDIFTLNLKWLEEFAELFRRRVGLRFWCNSHVGHLSDRAVRLLRHAGCVRVQIGIESGSEHLRRKILGKKFGDDKILEVARRLKRHHIKIVTYFMMGIPGETEGDILASMELCREIDPDWVLVSTFTPYPGTRLYEELVADGRLDAGYYKRSLPHTYYSGEGAIFDGGLGSRTHGRYYEKFVEIARGGNRKNFHPK